MWIKSVNYCIQKFNNLESRLSTLRGVRLTNNLSNFNPITIHPVYINRPLNIKLNKVLFGQFVSKFQHFDEKGLIENKEENKTRKSRKFTGKFLSLFLFCCIFLWTH